MATNLNSETEIQAEEHIIHFPVGLIGFELLKDYKIFSSKTEEKLYWLQPIDDQGIEFTVTHPSTFHINYEINLNNEEENLIDYQDGDELTILITLSKNFEAQSDQNRLKPNLAAPIIINADKKLGLQKNLSEQEVPHTSP